MTFYVGDYFLSDQGRFAEYGNVIIAPKKDIVKVKVLQRFTASILRVAPEGKMLVDIQDRKNGRVRIGTVGFDEILGYEFRQTQRKVESHFSKVFERLGIRDWNQSETNPIPRRVVVRPYPNLLIAKQIFDVELGCLKGEYINRRREPGDYTAWEVNLSGLLTLS